MGCWDDRQSGIDGWVKLRYCCIPKGGGGLWALRLKMRYSRNGQDGVSLVSELQPYKARKSLRKLRMSSMYQDRLIRSISR